jgi:hypothetical protein|tara:strand:- start:2198 stop:2737 length:540 start_codon:yes stop_codon:yes gene_type:complete
VDGLVTLLSKQLRRALCPVFSWLENMAGKLNKTKMMSVCDELAKGKSLRSICENDDQQPHWVTVLQAVQRDEDLYEMYSRARAIGAEVLADEMHDLARQPLKAEDSKFANAEVQRRRVEIDTLKWTFARMQPRGVRHKKEDVDNGEITLSWGGGEEQVVDQAQAQAAATVLKLVPSKDK